MFNILGCHKIQIMTICLTYEHQKTGDGAFLKLIYLNFNIMENDESSGFKAVHDFDFLAQ